MKINNIKCIQKPEIVYRYRSGKQREIDAILNDQIWLSNPTAFDDPWDCALSPRLEALPKEALIEINRLRVACFTTRNDNARMWSHYGREHRGICIGYSTSGISLNSWDIRPVKYASKIPRNNMLSSYSDVDAHETFNNLVTIKSQDWKDQEEWRYISWKTCGDVQEIDQDDLISITFGLRCSPRVKKTLLDTVGFYGHVRFQEVYRDPRSVQPCIRDCAAQHGKT